MVGRALSSGGGNSRVEGGAPKSGGGTYLEGWALASWAGLRGQGDGSLKQQEAGPLGRGGARLSGAGIMSSGEDPAGRGGLGIRKTAFARLG